MAQTHLGKILEIVKAFSWRSVRDLALIHDRLGMNCPLRFVVVRMRRVNGFLTSFWVKARGFSCADCGNDIGNKLWRGCYLWLNGYHDSFKQYLL